MELQDFDEFPGTYLLPSYMSCTITSCRGLTAFCLPLKEAIDLVLNASKATISSKSDVILGTASHLYAVGSKWSKEHKLGRMLRRNQSAYDVPEPPCGSYYGLNHVNYR